MHPKTLSMNIYGISSMCLPGYGMQGLDHLYIFVYPSLLCLQANQSLNLYEEHVSEIIIKMLAILGESRWNLNRRISKMVRPWYHHLLSRMLSPLPKLVSSSGDHIRPKMF